MGKILVTGASGNLGRETLRHLLNRRPASDLVGLARDPAKAADLAELGIEIRKGDYFDYDSLVTAFTDIEKVMLVATVGFSDRNTQHYNAITAARQVGVKHIVYTSIIRREGSSYILPEGTVPDLFGEQTVQASGLTYTLVRHPPYLESLQFQIGDKVFENGVRVPAGDGKAGFALRDELGEAQAAILTEDRHENKIYQLAGVPVGYKDIAAILSDIRGTNVAYTPVSDSEYIQKVWVADGLPDFLGQFALAWAHGVTLGEFDKATDDLEKLIGRRPTTAASFLRDNYPVVVPQLEAMRQRPASA